MYWQGILLWLLFQLATAEPHSRSQQQYLVKNLPDTEGLKRYKMHAGDVPVNNQSGTFFFWRIEPEHSTPETPLILWLNGGPGCSSFEGAMLEIGPYHVDNNSKLHDNEYTWARDAVVVFVDQPVGTGLSSVGNGNYTKDWDTLVNNWSEFMQKYLDAFRVDSRRKAYLTGESYAGQYIPYFAKQLADDDMLDLKGLMIGNGAIDPDQDTIYLKFAREHNLVPHNYQPPSYGKCQRDPNTCDNVLTELFNASTTIDPNGKCFNVYNYRLRADYPGCGSSWPPEVPAVQKYLRRSDVLDALNSHTGQRWVECSGPAGDALGQPDPTSLRLVPELLAKMPVLFYNGDLDVICNYMGTEKVLNKLQWGDGITGFGGNKPQQREHGLWSEHGNLRYARVYNASHMVPYDHPQVAYKLLQSILH